MYEKFNEIVDKLEENNESFKSIEESNKFMQEYLEALNQNIKNFTLEMSEVVNKYTDSLLNTGFTIDLKAVKKVLDKPRGDMQSLVYSLECIDDMLARFGDVYKDEIIACKSTIHIQKDLGKLMEDITPEECKEFTLKKLETFKNAKLEGKVISSIEAFNTAKETK